MVGEERSWRRRLDDAAGSPMVRRSVKYELPLWIFCALWSLPGSSPTATFLSASSSLVWASALQPLSYRCFDGKGGRIQSERDV